MVRVVAVVMNMVSVGGIGEKTPAASSVCLLLTCLNFCNCLEGKFY